VREGSVAVLVGAMRELHGCHSRLVAAVPVLPQHYGQTAGEGEVQVIDLIGHASGQRADVWSHETEGGWSTLLAVFYIAPVDSPAAAVPAAIVDDHQAT